MSGRITRRRACRSLRSGAASQFAAVNGNPKYPYQWDTNNLQPRAGFAFMLTERTILRGGYGLYFLNVTGTTTQNGFSIQTPLITSNDSDRTSTFPLANPFSQGISEAPGSAQGLETFLGRGPSFSNLDYLNPYVHQFSLGVQRQLPWRTSVEISYVGSRTKQEQNSWGGFNEPSLELRDRCDVTKGGSAAFCNELLPNPFFNVAGFEGTNRFTSQTLSRFELSRPYPQFTGFSEFERNDGQIWYNSLQVTANKRMSDGISLAGTWTFAKMIEENGFRDDLAKILQKSAYTTDRRHRVTMSGVYNLPFGRGRKYMNSSGPVVEALAGGWEVAGMWLFNTGRPWDLPGNVFYVKDAKLDKVEYTPTSIRAVQNCVSTMNDAGVVTMLAFSVAAGCTEPNFIIRPNFTGRTTEFRDDAIRQTAVLSVRHQLREDDATERQAEAPDPVRAVQRLESGRVRRAAVRQQPDRSLVRDDRPDEHPAIELPALRAVGDQADLLSGPPGLVGRMVS